MSLSIDDLKERLADAVEQVPPGMSEPLTALYARDHRPIRLPATKLRPTSLSGRWIATFAVALALCIALLIGIGVARSPSQKPTTDRAGGITSQVRLRPAVAATSQQLDRDAMVLVRRLQIAGTPGPHATVSGNTITLTAKEGRAKLQTVLAGLLAPGNLLLRPVICAAPSYDSAQPEEESHALPTTCPSANLLDVSNNDVNVSTGQPDHSPDAWSELSTFRSTPLTAADAANATVLLPDADWTSSNCQPLLGAASQQCTGNPDAGDRLLLGPAPLTSLDFASARAVLYQPSWVITVNLNSEGAVAWDALTNAQFHAYIAVEFDGKILSVPITEPTQSSYTSLGPVLQITTSLRHSAAARRFADILQSGPLPVALVETGSSAG